MYVGGISRSRTVISLLQYTQHLSPLIMLLGLSLCLLASGLPRSESVSPTQQAMMDDIVSVWNQFRDPDNGFWCDTLRFSSGMAVDILPT